MKTIEYMNLVLANLSNVVKCDKMGITIGDNELLFYIRQDDVVAATSIKPHFEKEQVLCMMVSNVRRYVDLSVEGL